MMNGLSTINIELTSRCQANCPMCGRRKIEQEHPDIVSNYGDMDILLLKKIANQVPENIVVQFHNNGEPTLYPHLKLALSLFNKQIRSFNTNAILLNEKADDIINNLETLVISVVDTGEIAERQLENVKAFIKKKGSRKPRLIFRCLGENINTELYQPYGTVITRILHSPMGSFDYEKKVTIPEIGICLDLLNHLAIDKDGIASICVRFDPERKGVIGDLKSQSLYKIWNSAKRKEWINLHVKGNRKDVPLCSTCEFYGVARGY